MIIMLLYNNNIALSDNNTSDAFVAYLRLRVTSALNLNDLG